MKTVSHEYRIEAKRPGDGKFRFIPLTDTFTSSRSKTEAHRQIKRHLAQQQDQADRGLLHDKHLFHGAELRIAYRKVTTERTEWEVQ